MSELTDEQREAVRRPAPLYVEACPGAGKTRVIMERFARLADSCGPRRGVAALTFTNAAADEIRRRCGAPGARLGWPHFVGTMDAFLARNLVIPFVSGTRRPRVVESWDALGATISLAGVSIQPIPLSKFDFPSTGEVTLDPTKLGGSFGDVAPHKAKLEYTAKRRRDALVAAGFFAPADVRARAAQVVRTAESTKLARALVARFVEVIVDEAQDSNDEDWQVLGWLRAHGMPVVVVADPHQAIYEFRNSLPEGLHGFTKGHPPVLLTGNFRSSPVICALAATFRPARPVDRAVGEHSERQDRVLLIPHGRVNKQIGEAFLAALNVAGIAPASAAVLAFARNDARRAVAMETSSPGGGASARLHNLVAKLRGAVPAAERLKLIRVVEQFVLTHALGDLSESTESICERHDVSPRWLRRAAISLGAYLREQSSLTEASGWTVAANQALHALDWPAALHAGRHAKLHKPRSPLAVVASPLHPSLRVDTIHGAKGQEFDAVLIVLAGATRNGRATIIDAWKSASDEEAIRVGYVAVTRARRLCALAIPRDEVSWVAEKLHRAGVAATVHEAQNSGGTGRGKPGASSEQRQIGLFGGRSEVPTENIAGGRSEGQSP